MICTVFLQVVATIVIMASSSFAYAGVESPAPQWARTQIPQFGICGRLLARAVSKVTTVDIPKTEQLAGLAYFESDPSRSDDSVQLMVIPTGLARIPTLFHRTSNLTYQVIEDGLSGSKINISIVGGFLGAKLSVSYPLKELGMLFLKSGGVASESDLGEIYSLTQRALQDLRAPRLGPMAKAIWGIQQKMKFSKIQSFEAVGDEQIPVVRIMYTLPGSSYRQTVLVGLEADHVTMVISKFGFQNDNGVKILKMTYSNIEQSFFSENLVRGELLGAGSTTGLPYNPGHSLFEFKRLWESGREGELPAWANDSKVNEP